MGFGLQLLDSECKTQDKPVTSRTSSQSHRPSVSQQNAQLYTYYEELINDYSTRFPNANDKLALALILGRGYRPTVSRNRELSFLDIDKMISLKHKSLGQNDNRLQNMKLAADLTGLKNNLLVRQSQEPQAIQIPQNNDNARNQQRGNFQIFRLIRAAQMHFMREPREGNQRGQLDIVNTSADRIQSQ